MHFFIIYTCKYAIMTNEEKINRLLVISEIIATNEIEKQEYLLELLKKKGFVLTQATLSRDLKELKISKIQNSKKKYVYTLAINEQKINKKINYSISGFHSIRMSKNIAVIKTKSGYANSFASKIDDIGFKEIIGTVAGDDTIMLVIDEKIRFKKLKKILIVSIPELKKYI